MLLSFALSLVRELGNQHVVLRISRRMERDSVLDEFKVNDAQLRSDLWCYSNQVVW